METVEPTVGGYRPTGGRTTENKMHSILAATRPVKVSQLGNSIINVARHSGTQS